MKRGTEQIALKAGKRLYYGFPVAEATSFQVLTIMSSRTDDQGWQDVTISGCRRIQSKRVIGAKILPLLTSLCHQVSDG